MPLRGTTRDENGTTETLKRLISLKTFQCPQCLSDSRDGLFSEEKSTPLRGTTSAQPPCGEDENTAGAQHAAPQQTVFSRETPNARQTDNETLNWEELAMNHKNWLKMSVLLLFGLVLLCGCQESKNLGWSESGFPDREIVFQPRFEDNTFGFIRPDGSGLITRTIAPEAYVGYLPTWSPSGQFITFRSEYASGEYFEWMRIRVVSAKGQTVGWCKDEKFLERGRVWVTWDDKLLFPFRSEQEETFQIVLADLKSCKIISPLFETPYLESEYLDSASLSSQGWLAVSRISLEEAIQVGAEVIDLESKGERVVGHGIAPAWSRDGEWLAFTGQDGLYIVGKDGTQRRRVVEMESAPNDENRVLGPKEMTTASWSPDGKALNPGSPLLRPSLFGPVRPPRGLCPRRRPLV